MLRKITAMFVMALSICALCAPAAWADETIAGATTDSSQRAIQTSASGEASAASVPAAVEDSAAAQSAVAQPAAVTSAAVQQANANAAATLPVDNVVAADSAAVQAAGNPQEAEAADAASAEAQQANPEVAQSEQVSADQQDAQEAEEDNMPPLADASEENEAAVSEGTNGASASKVGEPVGAEAANEIIPEKEVLAPLPASSAAGSSQQVAVVSVGAPAENITTEQKATSNAPAAKLANGLYNIASAISPSVFVDVPGGSKSNGTNIGLYADNSTPAQRWKFTALSNGFYTIVNVNSGLALDVPGQQAKNGAKLHQYALNGTIAQQWKIEAAKDGSYLIRSAVNDKYVLDVPGQQAKNGQLLHLYTANNTVAQLFKLNPITAAVSNGFYTLTNSNSGKTLDVAGGSLEDTSNVWQYDANNTIAQTYQFTYNKNNGYYTLINAGSGKALDVAGGYTYDGANVWQYSPNETLAQYWAVTKNSDGTLTIKSAKSGKALSVAGNSKSNGANVQINNATGSAAQKWKTASKSTWLPNGTYFFHNGKVHGNVMAVQSESVANAANILTQVKDGSNAQRFYVRSVGNGYYTIQNTYSGKYVDAASTKSLANVTQTGTKEQWKPVLTPNGIVFQLKGNTNVVLDMYGGVTSPGTNIHLYTSNGTLAQKWLLKATNLLADGSYTIASAANTNFVMDIPGQSQANGTNLSIYTANKTIAQSFALTHKGSDKYTIKSLSSNKMLQAGNPITQQAATSASSQQWIVQLNADGTLSFVSAANTKNKISVNGSVANSAKVASLESNGKNTQNWVVRKTNVVAQPSTQGKVSYDNLSITMAELAALEGVGSYYLDPNNVNKYQFLDLRSYSGTSAETLDNALQQLAPWIAEGNPLYKTGKYFVEAAKKYNLNEIFLLVHAGQETGWGAAANFGGYYNFFGVDGGAGTGSAAAGNAAQRGWTTVEKGIIGGAQFIADEWVYRKNYPQHTPYGLRYDYNYASKTGSYGYHHYTTNNSWLGITADHIEQVYGYTKNADKASFIYPKFK